MKRIDWLALGSLLASGLLTALTWSRLPDPFPIHFDVHGVADGWAPRAWGAWFVPLLGVGLFVLIRVVTPRFASAPGSVRPLALVALTMSTFVALLQVAILAAVTDALSIARSLPLLMGGMWFVLGLLFPRLRRNAFVGVRTAWSLASDENWARTHRVASPFMVIGGLAAMLAVLAGTEVALPVALAALLASALAGTVASFVVTRRAR